MKEKKSTNEKFKQNYLNITDLNRLAPDSPLRPIIIKALAQPPNSFEKKFSDALNSFVEESKISYPKAVFKKRHGFRFTLIIPTAGSISLDAYKSNKGHFRLIVMSIKKSQYIIPFNKELNPVDYAIANVALEHFLIKNWSGKFSLRDILPTNTEDEDR